MTLRGYIGIGILAALVLLSLAVSIQTGRLNRAKADQHDPATHRLWKDEAKQAAEQLKVAQANFAQCQTNRAGLQADLDRQSADTEAWKAAGVQAHDTAVAAVAQAHQVTVAADKRIATAMAAKPGAGACPTTDDLILGSLAQ